ncbi:hypothetical protein [Tolypothrix sp. NIES-4075]|uniref:hypothetical protein n=1 Tax=Tolypothrix sp. NIES-4075 TaxID=2005459 RepID=UPI00135BF33F|nr:hypothetical protein [Tolypothrix sp. NIES-4075]
MSCSHHKDKKHQDFVFFFPVCDYDFLVSGIASQNQLKPTAAIPANVIKPM